jgi:hypothetical protein
MVDELVSGPCIAVEVSSLDGCNRVFCCNDGCETAPAAVRQPSQSVPCKLSADHGTATWPCQAHAQNMFLNIMRRLPHKMAASQSRHSGSWQGLGTRSWRAFCGPTPSGHVLVSAVCATPFTAQTWSRTGPWRPATFSVCCSSQQRWHTDLKAMAGSRAVAGSRACPRAAGPVGQ